MKKEYVFRLTYFVVACLALAIFTVVFVKDTRTSQLNQSKLRCVEFSGIFSTDEGKTSQNLTVEALEEVGAVENLTVTGHFSEDIEKNEQMFIYLRRISVEIFQNGKLIYSYGGDGTHLPILRTAGSVWGNFYSEGISSEDEITIKFHNPYPRNSSKIYALCIQRFFVGDRYELLLHMMKNNIYTIVSCGLIFLMGIVLLFLALTLKMMSIKNVRVVFDCGMMFIVISMWVLMDYSYISLLIPLGMTIDVLDTIAVLSIPTLALRYVRDFMITGIRHVLGVLEYVLLLATGIYLLLQARGVIDGEIMQEIFLIGVPLLLGITFVCLALEMKKNPKGEARLVMGSSIFFILFGVFGYIWYEISDVHGTSLVGVGLVGSAVAQYIILIKHMWAIYKESVRAREMEKELMESKMAIMISQIQPHFLYNSISSIQELCLCEPKKAYDALAQFAHFLRGNMDSLGSTRPIPFEQELRHVKNYLALEKIRFEERLNVVYDLAEEGFFMPALTLQPIVENAVRYGISKKKEGGTVTISTYSTEKEVVVTIADDGVGFDVEGVKNIQDGRTHIGMDNVRKRLKSQCKGRMKVNSVVGKGTVVQLILPKNGLQEES